MKRYWEQLKPQERRWMVIISIVVFAMINWFFVWPYRGAWGKSKEKLVGITRTNAMYNAEISRKAFYTRRINELKGDSGDEVPPEDQASDFIRFITTRAINNKILILNQGALVTSTNQFFLKQQMGITVQADETNLVNFLYSLGAGNSMMRVRAMSLHPEASHQQLNASLTMVADYSKKAAGSKGPSSTKATTTPAPAPRPGPPVAAPAWKPPPTNNVAAAGSKPSSISSTNKPGPSITKKP